MNQADPTSTAEAILALHSMQKRYGSMPVLLSVDGKNFYPCQFKVDVGDENETLFVLKIIPSGKK